MRRGTLVVLLVLSAAGCDHKKKAPPTASAQASASAAPKPKPPWYIGHWSGAYAASKQDMGKMVGPEIAWQKDEGGTARGVGKLSLDISKERHVIGKASGPLGNMGARGTLDGDTLRLRLVPAEHQVGAFTGIVIAHREGNADILEGTLHASSGNSKIVRDAKVKLKKGDTSPELELPKPPSSAEAGASAAPAASAASAASAK